MIHWLLTAWNTYVLHPEHGNGYQWHSGIGSDWSEITLVGGAGMLLKHHNCHHKGCWRAGHRHPVYGWPSCKKHWNEKPAHVDSQL